MNIEHLPQALRDLVHQTVSILGDVIKEDCGGQCFSFIETTRQQMLSYRNLSEADQINYLRQLFHTLESTPREQRRQIAHGFTLMMELINACENAYRTFRLQGKSWKPITNQRSDNNIVFVLTAHPTEARSGENITLFQQIQAICLKLLSHETESDLMLKHLKHQLKLAWKLPVARHRRPTVIDEAEHLYSIVLRKEVLSVLLHANRQIANIRVRTWVGGDKDGHPGVNEKTLLKSLRSSRVILHKTISKQLANFGETLQLLKRKDLLQHWRSTCRSLSSLKILKAEDGTRLTAFKNKLLELKQLYLSYVDAAHPDLNEIEDILTIFPGLVIPIELREASDQIGVANEQQSGVIINMLRLIRSISEGANAYDYAQGLVVSMTQSTDDILKAVDLVEQNLGSLEIPVIPLFETEQALVDAPEIITKLLQVKLIQQAAKKYWRNRLEVMVGYSDSAKLMGVIASRVTIAKTVRAISEIIQSHHLTPIFFHGAGGSVDRGGGSIREQTNWWPKSALEYFKMTVQGEMVERTFASPDILLSQIQTIQYRYHLSKQKKRSFDMADVVSEFADAVKNVYKTTLADDAFLKLVNQATPYPYLNALKIGSRPAKRAQTLSFDSIRAIPWVLCWTQTRLLFPTWWGIGSIWQQFQSDINKKTALLAAHENDRLFRSFIKSLGFTLAKVALPIWRLYLDNADLPTTEADSVYARFQQEYQSACDFVFTMTGKDDLLWFRPWLKESIYLRSPMIHPINLVQILAFKEKDYALLRESVTGIASGMLTTG